VILPISKIIFLNNSLKVEGVNVVLNDEIKDAIEKNLVFLATSSKDGIPNVVPVGFARPIDDETILIADNYLNKTRKNLDENPKLNWNLNQQCYSKLKISIRFNQALMLEKSCK